MYHDCDILQVCLQIAKGAREGGYHPTVAVTYDEIIRKQLADQSQKNGPDFHANSEKLRRVDKHMLERAIKLNTERQFGHGKSSGKGKDMGKASGKGAGKDWGKGKSGKGAPKGHGKNDNRSYIQSHYENRGEKRSMPWNTGYSDNKKWKGSGRGDSEITPPRTRARA